MTTVFKTDLGKPVESRQDLINYLLQGAKPAEEWRVGAEIENLVVNAETGEAAPYSVVEDLLKGLERSGGWQGVREDGHLIALMGGVSSITLEPGGQVELSGQLCSDIHCCHSNFAHHVTEVLDGANGLGLCFLGMGVQPFTPLEQITWVPKHRYNIMAPYMRKTGDMGQRMMKQSAGLQVNFDYSDELDCIAKLRVSQAISPLLYALFANSPFLEGRPSGFLSTRGEIWSRTDPDRTGLIPQLFAEGAGLDTYVEYALDVPMYFILREGSLLDLTAERFTFRRFLSEGFAGFRATVADWDLHLSTLFTEVRLRPQIEIRSADSLPPGLTLAVATLLKGILYDSAALSEVWDLFKDQDDETRDIIYRRSWKQGLKTPMGKRTLREVALDVLAVVRESLKRQHRINEEGGDESIYLEGIQEIAESGVTLAERLLDLWKGSRSEKWKILQEYCGLDLL